jgi:hypothetical protein
MAARTLQEFSAQVASDPGLQQQLQQDPVATVATAARSAAVPDTWVYRVVVSALGLVAVGGLALVAALVINGDTPPDLFTAAVSAAIGALAGLLAPSPNSSS